MHCTKKIAVKDPGVEPSLLSSSYNAWKLSEVRLFTLMVVKTHIFLDYFLCFCYVLTLLKFNSPIKSLWTTHERDSHRGSSRATNNLGSHGGRRCGSELEKLARDFIPAKS